MDGGDGCHVAAGGGGAPPDKTIINRIMLRFRPIAPKPVPSGSLPGDNSPENPNRCSYSPAKRVKRKYTRNKKANSRSSTGDPHQPNADVDLRLHNSTEEKAFGDLRSWLSLAPETPAIRDHVASSSRVAIDHRPFSTFNGGDASSSSAAGSELITCTTAVETRVTVESVSSDTCVDYYEVGLMLLGCTDRVRMSLDEDTCPGFISDGYNRVEWVNEAYKRMVESREVRVNLVTKAELPVGRGRHAFSCSVRLEKEKEKGSRVMVVPCDVWRMEESGGLAWRLDMKAALSLGL